MRLELFVRGLRYLLGTGRGDCGGSHADGDGAHGFLPPEDDNSSSFA